MYQKVILVLEVVQKVAPKRSKKRCRRFYPLPTNTSLFAVSWGRGGSPGAPHDGGTGMTERHMPCSALRSAARWAVMCICIAQCQVCRIESGAGHRTHRLPAPEITCSKREFLLSLRGGGLQVGERVSPTANSNHTRKGQPKTSLPKTVLRLKEKKLEGGRGAGTDAGEVTENNGQEQGVVALGTGVKEASASAGEAKAVEGEQGPQKKRRRRKNDRMCEHNRQAHHCKDCGGSGICEHGRQRHNCKVCGGTSICEHGKERYFCRPCGGKGFCEHGRRKYLCQLCGGRGICIHSRRKDGCKLCGGGRRSSPRCVHNRQKRYCVECGGSAMCEHGRQKYVCKLCGGAALCEHGVQKRLCMLCPGRLKAHLSPTPTSPSSLASWPRSSRSKSRLKLAAAPSEPESESESTLAASSGSVLKTLASFVGSYLPDSMKPRGSIRPAPLLIKAASAAAVPAQSRQTHQKVKSIELS
eukprot:1588789-Rhodomonas_salina.3